LEQEKLEMVKYYEQKIKDRSAEHKAQIDKLLQEFRINLNKVQDEYEECKRTAKSLKGYYDSKLTNLENEHEDEID